MASLKTAKQMRKITDQCTREEALVAQAIADIASSVSALASRGFNHSYSYVDSRVVDTVESMLKDKGYEVTRERSLDILSGKAPKSFWRKLVDSIAPPEESHLPPMSNDHVLLNIKW